MVCFFCAKINEDKTLKGFELLCHIEHLLGVNELSFKVNK